MLATSLAFLLGLRGEAGARGGDLLSGEKAHSHRDGDEAGVERASLAAWTFTPLR